MLKDDAYLKDRTDAQIYRQASMPLLRKLDRYNRRIAQFIKTMHNANTKKLTEWGIPIKLGKLGGEVLFNQKIKDIELISKAILAKNTADGANSILHDFDIADMQTTYDAYLLKRAQYKEAQNGWRSASISRREDMNELRKMQHLIARELINNPSFNDRDLEQLGYTLIENHKYKSDDDESSAA